MYLKESTPENQAKSPGKTGDAAPPPAPTIGTPTILRMDEVQESDIRWLWLGRIALGRMSLLVGRPGLGKSFLTAQMAANVSLGRPWPDGSPCPAGTVIIISAEDDPADTVKPRLLAHGADLSKIVMLTGVAAKTKNGKLTEAAFTLANLDALRSALEAFPDCRLIVVDPIGSYLGGKTDAHRDNEVRSVLAPAAALAAEYGAALVVVAHNRKSAAAHADDTAMGSRAFTGLARSVLHLLSDPDDAEKARRLLLPGKNNSAAPTPGLAFRIGPGEVPDRSGGYRPCLQWDSGAVELSADEVASREAHKPGPEPAQKSEAERFLTQALAAGGRPSKDIIEEAGEVAGISAATLKRAKKAMGIESYRNEVPGPWWWRLAQGDHVPPNANNLNILNPLRFKPKKGDYLDPLANVDNSPKTQQIQDAQDVQAPRELEPLGVESGSDGGWEF